MGTSDFQSNRTEARVRSYRCADRRSLAVRLGPVISELYPGGDAWLRRRLDDVERGMATCTVVTRLGLPPLGAAIETPKERGRVKLSTLWVDPAWRGRGLGESLLLGARRRWIGDELQIVNLTAEASVAAGMAGFLAAGGFRVDCIDRDRYGEGRHEVVFGWRPDLDPIVAGPRERDANETDLYVASK